MEIAFREIGTFEGYVSGGAWLAKNGKTGLYEGMLYAYHVGSLPGPHGQYRTLAGIIGVWESNGLRIPAKFGHVWQSNMGDWRQSVRFTYEGLHFAGTYYCSSSDIVRVRQVKKG